MVIEIVRKKKLDIIQQKLKTLFNKNLKLQVLV